MDTSINNYKFRAHPQTDLDLLDNNC